MLRCDSCGSEMRVGKKYLSGNSRFAEFFCTNCFNRKTVCELVAVK